MTSTIYTTIPPCTNPRCPAPHPHGIAEFGFATHYSAPNLTAAYTRLQHHIPRSRDAEILALFTLCHGGAFNLKIDPKGDAERVGICPHDCHKSKQLELIQEAEKAGVKGWDRVALMQWECAHGMRPERDGVVERGRFVRVRERCAFADLAVGQQMVREKDVFDDERFLFSKGVPVKSE